MHFPFDELALKNKLLELQLALLGGAGRGRRRIIPPHEKDVRDFGASLYEALFTGEVRRLLDLSRDEARGSGRGLRIKLRCRVPHLSALPWEFLFDESADEYLCLSRNTPVVRYLEVASRLEPIKVEAPLRILAVVSSPQGLPELDVAREKERIDEALGELEKQGLVVVEWLAKATWRELQKVLSRDTWHVFHYVGHGGFDDATGEGILGFENDDGTLHRLGATELGMLLGDHEPLRLAVLNSCEGARQNNVDVFSSTAAVLVRRGTPGVVAMQYEITDLAAIELAQTFYEFVAHGTPVDAALGEARKAVRLGLPGTLEWGTPVLFMRSPDGVLFDVVNVPPAKPIEERAPEVVDEKEPQPPKTPLLTRLRLTSLPRRLGAAAVALALVAGVLALANRDGNEGTGTGPLKLNTPKGIAIAPDGSLLIADAYGGRIMAVKPDGTTEHLAGDPKAETAESGKAIGIRLDYPGSVTAAADGTVYISEHGLNVIRKLKDGQLTTIHPEPGGDTDVRATALSVMPARPPSNATLNRRAITQIERPTLKQISPVTTIPQDVEDPTAIQPGTLLIATSFTIYALGADNALRRIAGTGQAGYSEGARPADQARLNNVEGMVARADGTIFIADGSNGRIRQITPDGTIATIAGNGGGEYMRDGQPALEGSLDYPVDVALDGDGNLYFLDGKTVFRLNPDGTASVVVRFSDSDGFGGDEGPASEAMVKYRPEGLAIANTVNPDVFILDTDNNRVRRVDYRGIVTTVA
jgi:sugar lactone lactonase YvrE